MIDATHLTADERAVLRHALTMEAEYQRERRAVRMVGEQRMDAIWRQHVAARLLTQIDPR